MTWGFEYRLIMASKKLYEITHPKAVLILSLLCFGSEGRRSPAKFADFELRNLRCAGVWGFAVSHWVSVYCSGFWLSCAHSKLLVFLQRLILAAYCYNACFRGASVGDETGVILGFSSYRGA